MGKPEDTSPEIPSIRREEVLKYAEQGPPWDRETQPPSAPDPSTPSVVRRGYPILEHFEFEHLPPHLASISQPFCELAHQMATELPHDAETSAGLRKLLEAKDCFVRARRIKDR